MSTCSNVTQKDLNNLRNLAEQQKNQRALKYINRISKQTHDVKLAVNSSPVTKNVENINDLPKN